MPGRGGRAIGGAGNLEAALRELGRDAEQVVAQAYQRENEDGLATQTQAAIDLGIFGAPTFKAGAELFWGDDRLEDAIEWCLNGKLSPSVRDQPRSAGS